MATQTRQYSDKTLKILFGLSGNQCTHPECTNNVIEPATEHDDAAVIAQICHIYAVSAVGPRGRAGLTDEELKSPKNLILFCPTHHVVVDKQYETYPAELLKQWKKEHEDKVMASRLSENLENVPQDLFISLNFPKALVDQKIKDDTEILRKSRSFPEFDSVNSSLILARKLAEGELAGGTTEVRCRALAWCVRILSTQKLDKAEEYLRYAKELGTCEEIDIANAFISSQKGKKNAALRTLTDIDSPMSLSAALMVVANHEGPQGAVNWLQVAGINATTLDSDGKKHLLGCQLELADWEAAQECLGLLSDDDLRDTPVLHHLVAITHLLRAVPDELRSGVLHQIPFEAADFPLDDSSPIALEARRAAYRSFINAAEVARQLSCPLAEKIDDEYALWLELKDRNKCEEGKKRLRSKLSDPKTSLRLVHLGLQFGIKMDLAAVEQEIKRQIVLTGGMTYDTTIARLAIVFAQQTPAGAANYIAQYFDELVSHIDKKSLLFLQIDLFSQAGQLEKAKECLDILLQEGLPEIEENRLRIIISGAEGKIDPVESLKEQFRKTKTLNDLGNLIRRLVEREDWNGLCEYGKILFKKTRELRHAEDLALALCNSQENAQLVDFVKSNKKFLQQSKKLSMLYCWSLYHEGELLEARSELARLNDDWDDVQYRTLQIYLSISLARKIHKKGSFPIQAIVLY